MNYKNAFILFGSCFVLAPVVYADDTGTASAQGIANQLIQAAQQSTTHDAANNTLNAIGISAQTVGTGADNPSDDRGARGFLSGYFKFKITPACTEDNQMMSTGLSGTKIITYCHAPTGGSVMAKVCFLNGDKLKECQSSDYITINIPTNGSSIAESGATWSGRCNTKGNCYGTMSIAHDVVTNNDKLDDDANNAARNSLVANTVKASYPKAETYMKSMSSTGENSIFVNCMNNAHGFIESGKYYSCSGAKSGDFNGDYTHNTDIFTQQSTDNFAPVAGYLGAIDKMQNDVSVYANNTPFLFRGELSYCEYPAHILFENNCCNDDVSNHGFHWYSCKDHDFELAESKRAKRVKVFDKYCSHEHHGLIAKWCTDYRQNACIFSSHLALLVQEKGREQINNMVSGYTSNSDQNTKTNTLEWPYTTDTGTWNKADVNDVAIAAWSWPGISEKAIPVMVQLNKPLPVENDSSGVTSGLSATLHCDNGTCAGTFTSQGIRKNYSFTPNCIKGGPFTWKIATSTVSQGTCLNSGSQPQGWPKITWDGNTPSLWQFEVQGVIPSTIYKDNFSWILAPNLTVSGEGNCSSGACHYNVTYDNNGDKETGTFDFPLTCTNGDNYATTIGEVTLTPQCPGDGVVFAVCTKGDNCGALPADPESLIGLQFHDWLITEQPISRSNWEALTSSILVKGSCQSNDCMWDVKSLGPNGYPDTITDDVRWNLFSAPMNTHGQPQEGYSNDALSTASGIQIKPYLYGVNTAPPNEPIEFQLPGGSWQKKTLALSIDQSSRVTLSTSPTVEVWGGCHLITGVCDYKFASQVTLQAMSWGDKKNPNCNGFTPEQMLLINWDKLDLGDYQEHYKNVSLSEAQQSLMKSAASTQAQQFQQTLDQGGSVGSAQPTKEGNVVLQASPLEGNGPFEVTATLTGYWPQYVQPSQDEADPNTNPVDSVKIEWGDGTSMTLDASQLTLKKVNDSNGEHWVPGHYGGLFFKRWISGHWSNGSTAYIPIFEAKHKYAAPPANTNVIETITATFHTKTGTFTAKVDVQNIWDTPAEFYDEGGGGADAINNVQVNNVPGHGIYDAKQVPGLPE